MGEPVLPKIPIFGPASQLGTQVLVSRVGELGDAKSARENPRRQLPSKLGPAGPQTARERRVLLPSIAPSSAGTSNQCSAASLPHGGGAISVGSVQGSCSGKAPASLRPFAADVAPVSANGLSALLYKIDHAHSLKSISAEDSEKPGCESQPLPAEALLGGALGLGPAGGPLAGLQPGAPEVASKGPAAPADVGDQPRKSFQVRKSLKGRNFAIDMNAPIRDARIRASFRHEAAAIEAAIAGLQAWPGAKQPGSDGAPPASDLEELLTAFERTGLEATKPRARSLRHDEDLCGDVEGHEDPYGKASFREIASCTSVLNFTRWLCGLQPVEITEDKLKATDILSQALLPRAPVMVSAQLQKDVVHFSISVQKFMLQQNNRLSIFHGEGSLVAAVEQSLMATHCLKLPFKSDNIDCTSVAQAVTARIAADPRSRDLQLQLQRQRGVREPQPPQEHISAAELPSALEPLRFFWALQPPPEPPSDTQVHPHSHRRQTHLQHHHQPHILHPHHAGHHHGPPEAVDPYGGLYGLSAVWGDRHGALAFRRCLLNPALREFGAARRHDTCVLWTGCAAESEDRPPARGPDAPDAVCYPPTGLLPLALLLYGKRVAWTIAPDSWRFQPTAETHVRMWRVKVDRPADKDWTAERVSEVPIKAFTVDCATRGEPFCIIFWPDLPQYVNGDQFEVEVGGLRGPSSDLAFFYELRSFIHRVLDNSLYTEASRIRSTFGEKLLWGSSTQRACQPQPAAEVSAAVQRTTAVLASPVKASKPTDRRLPRKTHVPVPFVEESAPPAMEALSHPKTVVVCNTPDLTILLRCKQAASISAVLVLTRFGGEEEEVLFAAQVQKLPGQHFLVLVKLPMGRRNYLLRFHVSPLGAPEEALVHPLNYTITTTERCQSLLASLEDSNACKFGYAPVSPVAQTHGVILLAPMRRRVIIGQCYFLVYVDKAKALETAHAHAVAKGVGAPLPADATDAQLSPEEKRKKAAEEAAGAEETKLFVERLLAERRGLSGPVVDMHKALRSALRSHTQDCDGDVHFDISIHNGECVQPMHERCDMPGFYEGLVTFSGVDATHVVRLTIRFPRAHGAEYAPRVIGEWLACRSSKNLPPNF